MGDYLKTLAAAAFMNGFLHKPTPVILLLEPSERCNATCPFCYHWREQPKEGELSLPEIATLLRDAWSLGCRVLYLSGGEPTIYPDLHGLLSLAKRVGYRTTMTTNGSRLAETLPAIAPLLDGVTVSLDYAGPRQDEVRGIFKLYTHAVRGLEEARRHGISARINMSLGPDNLSEVSGLIDLARKVGAGLHVRLLTREFPSMEHPAFTKSEATTAATRLLELKRRNRDVLLTPAVYFKHIIESRPFRCRLLSLLLTVDSSGRVYVPCPKYEGAKERIAGSIRNHRLHNVWHSKEATELRREAARCTPTLDCYTSCLLDISLLANLSPGMILEQLSGQTSLLDYFWRPS